MERRNIQLGSQLPTHRSRLDSVGEQLPPVAVSAFDALSIEQSRALREGLLVLDAEPYVAATQHLELRTGESYLPALRSFFQTREHRLLAS